MGGKVPESARLRADLNLVDARGLKSADAVRAAQALRDTPLPHKDYYGQGIPKEHLRSE